MESHLSAASDFSPDFHVRRTSLKNQNSIGETQKLTRYLRAKSKRMAFQRDMPYSLGFPISRRRLGAKEPPGDSLSLRAGSAPVLNVVSLVAFRDVHFQPFLPFGPSFQPGPWPPRQLLPPSRLQASEPAYRRMKLKPSWPIWATRRITLLVCLPISLSHCSSCSQELPRSLSMITVLGCESTPSSSTHRAV